MCRELVVVETVAGSQLIGFTSDLEAFDACMVAGKPVVLDEVFRIVTLNVPVGPGEVMRVTKLARAEYVEGPADAVRVLVASYYQPSPQLVEKYIMPEIQALTARGPVEEPSRIVGVQAIPHLVRK